MKKIMSFSLLFFCLQIVVLAQCWKSASAGLFYTLALKTDGTIWGWGDNTYGDIGDGSNSSQLAPVQIGTDNDWIAIEAGAYHSIALKKNGTLWAWGFNGQGQLGDGTFINKNTPVQVGTSTDWLKIYTGLQHSLAQKKDGTLWAWGNNTGGQLGDGTIINKNIPTQIGTNNNWIALSAGGNFNLGIKSDGSLWSWGDNSNGRLGLGSSIVFNSTPTQIGSDQDWQVISAGGLHSLALNQNGELWAWGFGLWGQVGDGTSSYNNYLPIKIGTDNDWQSISAGGHTSLALKKDGSRWGWGENINGALGNGIYVFPNKPLLADNDNNWDVIFSGEFHFFSLRKDGTLWNWGYNQDGQLGDNSRISKNVPQLTSCPPSALPIELLSFQAKNQNNQNHLTWQTATETNNQGFEIERSINGIDFEKIGFIKGKGNSNQIQNYRFIDANPFSTSYYRLKQIDFDGKFEYSNTISIKIRKEKGIQFYPNPTNGIVTIESAEILNADILIYNNIGILVKTTKAQNNTINISDLPMGMYTVSMTNNENRFVKQIVKM